jgi:hypothetical protein
MSRNTWLVTAIAVLLVLSFVVGLNFDKHSSPQAQVNSIPTAAGQAKQPEQQGEQVGLDTQIRCSDAAKTFFSNWKSDPSLSNNWAQAIMGGGGTPSYDDHFNKSIAKCYIRIRGLLNDNPRDGDYYSLTFAYDVYENKLIGYSNSPSNPSKGIFLCEFPSNTGACANETAFENALAPYFDN